MSASMLSIIALRDDSFSPKVPPTEGKSAE
jgi:hypothetical protein